MINVPTGDVSMPNENENVYVAPPEGLPSPSPSPSPSTQHLPFSLQSQSQSHHNDALNPCQSAAETAAVLNQVVRRQQGICQRLRLRPQLKSFRWLDVCLFSKHCLGRGTATFDEKSKCCKCVAALHFFFCSFSFAAFRRDSFGPSNCKLMSKIQLCKTKAQSESQSHMSAPGALLLRRISKLRQRTRRP